MDCCVLSAEEVGRLVHYNILPSHDDHIHINSKDAIKGVIDDDFELVNGRDGRYYVTRTKMYFLRALPSGDSGIKVIQRIRSAQLTELKPLR
jgi:hypothetical protein